MLKFRGAVHGVGRTGGGRCGKDRGRGCVMNQEFIESVMRIVHLSYLSEFTKDKLDDLYREVVEAERERCAKKALECCASLEPVEVAEAIRSGK
jgi:hypothetical protein